MNLKIEMSFQNYCRMLKTCDTSSDEYVILANGFPTGRPRSVQSEVVVEIICNTQDATKLLAFADRMCPEAARDIEQSVDYLYAK